MTPLLRTTSDGAVLLKVAARPGASRSHVVGVVGEALKVAVNAPPERGKANKALVALLAKALGLRKAQVSLVGGGTSREKTFRLDGVEADAVRTRLAALLADG